MSAKIIAEKEREYMDVKHVLRDEAMDEIKALEVVRALADGVDPESGEVFGDGWYISGPT